MAAPHRHALHWSGTSPIHRLPAHVKIVVLVAYVLAVVATPRGVLWPYAAHLLPLAAAVLLSRVPLQHLATRMVVELPFVVFAVLLPFVATGPRTSIGPFEVSASGLEASVALLLKGTLGVCAALTLAATTEARDLVTGFEKLRLPHQLVEVMAFMIRYAEVIVGDLERMRIARESRGFRARSVRQWSVLASTLGALFIRSYERGERVHLAMLSRGYAGRMPTWRPLTATGAQWAVSGILPLVSLLATSTALVTA